MPRLRSRLFARATTSSLLLALSFGLVAPSFCAQGPNSDPIYQALRTLTLGSESVSLSNFDLKRDAGTFRFRSGAVCFTSPVNGKVTGAVFVGDGLLLLNPPSETERTLLKCHVQPAAKRLGITKQIGWHSFRRTFATLLGVSEDVKTMQELMRHANSRLTLDLYAQALTPAKRAAHRRLVGLIEGPEGKAVGPMWSHAERINAGK
jgi:hypothetical protein